MQLGKTPVLHERDADTCYYTDVGPKPIKHKSVEVKLNLKSNGCGHVCTTDLKNLSQGNNKILDVDLLK